MAKLGFDSASAFIAITSDICYNCQTESYQPGLSKTTHNTGLQWSLDYPLGKTKLGVIEFNDYIWINEQTYLADFTFYAIYE